METAKAVIIFTDKLSFDAHKQDTHIILQAMVIKNSINSMDKAQSAGPGEEEGRSRGDS